MNKFLSSILIILILVSTSLHSISLTNYKQKQDITSNHTRIEKRTIPILDDALKFLMRNEYNANNPYKYTPAVVRNGPTICDDESNFIQKRLAVAQANLETFLNQQLSQNQIPNIAICLSGGGYRAMISSLGFLQGLSDIGLLNSITYASSLSGSTWAMGAWTSLGCDLSTFTQNLTNNIALNNNTGLPAITNPATILNVIENITTDYLFDQNPEIVSLWGAIISNNIFTDPNAQNFKLSNQQTILNQGNWLFPIYTAVEPKSNNSYEWYEFSPFEIGSYYLNSYIPSWSFSRNFNNGTSSSLFGIGWKEYGPEPSFSYLLGTFGSAFEIDLQYITTLLNNQSNLGLIGKNAINFLLAKIPADISQQRLLPANFNNFTYGLNSSPIENQSYITLVDAGIDFNLPLPPLLRSVRNIDIIIIMDASEDLVNAPELAKAQAYAAQNNLKFPSIDYTNISKSLNLFIDQNDLQTPIIIYMPLVIDQTLPGLQNNQLLNNFDPTSCIAGGYCSTFNFSYTKEQFAQLFELMRFNVTQNQQQLTEIINNVIINKFKN